MAITIQNQKFGAEIELTGISRMEAAKVIADYFGTTVRYAGTYYNVYTATDRAGRTWKAMSDGSIHTERKVDGHNAIKRHLMHLCTGIQPGLSRSGSVRGDSRRLSYV